MADPCPPDLNPASTHHSRPALEPCPPDGQVISFASDWDDSALRAPLDAGVTDPAAGLALARGAWAASPPGADSSRRARAGLVLGLALNRAERYAEALSTLKQIHTTLQSPALSRERAVCQWQIGVAARFLRADREFVQPLETALETLMAEGLDIEAARCRRDLAAAHNWRGDYAASERQASQARVSFERRGLRADAAACAFPDSARLRWAGRFEAAHAVLSEAEAIFEGAGLPVERATAWLYQGSVHVAQLRFDRAAPLLQRAQAEFERLGLPARLALCHNERGLAALYRGLLGEAEAAYEHCRVAYQALDMRADLARSALNLGTVRFHQGRLLAARELYGQAQTEFRLLGDQWNQAACDLNVGDCEAALGRFGAALRHLERARGAMAELGATDSVAAAHDSLGRVWLALGSQEEAVAHLSRAVHTYREMGAHFAAARSQVQLALAEACLGQTTAALDHVQEARLAAADAGAPSYFAACDQAAGGILGLAGDHARAQTFLEAAEASFASLGMPVDALACTVARADSCLALEQTETAAALYHDALRTAEASLPDLAWRCAFGLARIAEAGGRRDEALTFYRRAMHALGQARHSLHHERLTDAFLAADRSDVLDRAVRAALLAHQADTALEFVEQGRAQLLAGRLGRAHPPASEADPHRQALRLELAELRHRLSAEHGAHGWSIVHPPDAEARALMAELEAKAREYQRHAALTGGESQTQPLALQLDRLRRALSGVAPSGWTCLSYAWSGARLLIFALDENGLQVYECEPGPIELLALDLGTSPEPDRRRQVYASSRAGQVYLQRLYDLLIPQAIRSRLSPDCLLAIVPAGRLHGLPFAALNDGQAHLAQRATLVHAPSLAALEHCLSRVPALPASADSALILSVEEFGEHVPPLPHSGEEARAVAGFFSDPITLRGKGATAEAFIERLVPPSGPYGVIHLATHAVFEARFGRLSRLLLHEGALQADEIEELPLQARLVVLSACQSALGQVHRGEESLGLTQAFFAAGAPSVLATFFAVDDPGARRFVREFYGAWAGQHRPPAFALAAAQRKWIAAGETPRAWAAFGLFGAP